MLRSLVLSAVARVVRAADREATRQWEMRLERDIGEFGERSYVHGSARITGVEKLVVGANVRIGENAFIRAEGGVSIGDNTHVSRNLVVYSMNHRYRGDRLPYDDKRDYRSVRIGKNVWIGMNVCVLPGACIGDGAIIGMGTVVAGEVPPLAVVGSAKWRVLKYRDESHYAALEAAGAYGGKSGRPLVPTSAAAASELPVEFFVANGD